MNVRKLHNDIFDSKKAAKVGQDASLKTSIVPDDAIIDLRNLVRDYYYFKDLQSAIVLKLNAELKVSFPAFLNVFSKVTTQTSLKLLEAYPLAADMLAAPKDELVKIIRSTARFGEKYALAKYDAICTAAKDAAVFGRALPSSALRIRQKSIRNTRRIWTAYSKNYIRLLISWKECRPIAHLHYTVPARSRLFKRSCPDCGNGFL